MRIEGMVKTKKNEEKRKRAMNEENHVYLRIAQSAHTHTQPSGIIH